MLIPHSAAAQVLNCNLDGYKPVEGLTATLREGVLEVKWRGERAQQLRAEFSFQDQWRQLDCIGPGSRAGVSGDQRSAPPGHGAGRGAAAHPRCADARPYRKGEMERILGCAAERPRESPRRR